MAFQFKIQLKGITSPPVWRRVLVPEDFSFYKLHQIIQGAFGWQDYHLFQFCEKEFDSFEVIGIPDPDFDEFDTKDSKKIKINKIFKSEGQKYTYIYDFGDNWEHTITLEKILAFKFPVGELVDGKGACPPEDCGGIHGFNEMKKILSNPKHPEYESMVEWLELDDDEPWNASEFDMEEAREEVRMIR